LNETGQKTTFEEDSFPPTATLYFKNCNDCEYVVDSMSTKILFEGCSNVKVTFNKKIVTGLVDIWKCNNFSFESNSKVGTLQLDICKGVTGHFKTMDLFSQCVWAGVFDLKFSFGDSDQKMETGFDKQQKDHAVALHEQVDQFIVRFVKEKLQCELIVRLTNGFPTTEREAREFDRRQDDNMRKLAEQAGITIAKKKSTTKKPGQNEPCHCGSGKKYKKCHFVQDQQQQ